MSQQLVWAFKTRIVVTTVFYLEGRNRDFLINRGSSMFLVSIVAGVLAYEMHKRKNHAIGIIFDILAVLFIALSWS